MSVVFENIKINSCYQYYNRGENGAVVRSKFDASWGGVRSIGEIQDELVSIKQQIIDLLRSGKELNDPSIKNLSGRLEEIKTKDLVNWESDVKSTLTSNISGIQNALNCTSTSPNARTLCSTENALSLLSNTDLVGYEVVSKAHSIRDNLPKNPDKNSSGASYSIVHGDRPAVTDNRFDILGESRYQYCLKIGESTNFQIYKEFISRFGLGSMADHLKNGNGVSLDFTNDLQIQSEIKSSSNFNEFIEKFQVEIKDKIVSNKANDINDIFFDQLVSRAEFFSPNFSILNGVTPTKIFVAMGGTQYYDISLIVYRKKNQISSISNLSNYIFDYNIEFQDTYGADFDDINSGIKGFSQALNSFFTLQHYYLGYKPYFTKVKVRKSFLYK